MNCTTETPAIKPYVEIPLSSRKYPGMVALVDAEDYELVKGYKWHVSKAHKNYDIYYAVATMQPSSNRKMVSMHRLLLGLKHGDKRIGEHMDGNGLDNRRTVNLRVATKQQNMFNQRPQSNRISKYKGVSWHDRACKWAANIKVNRKIIYLGIFWNQDEAAKAYDVAALKYHKEFARLNFPKIAE